MNECPLKRDHFKIAVHLPSINFQWIPVSFQGVYLPNRWIQLPYNQKLWKNTPCYSVYLLLELEAQKLPLFRVVVSNMFDIFTPNLVEDEPILISHIFQGKTTQLPFWIFSKRTKNHPAEVVSWPPEKKPPRDFSVSIENRGGEHPSTFYLPALVWVIFGIPPDEWIFHLWGRCFFSMMCFCFFAHNLFGRLLLKMCQLFFWKEKRLCLPGRLAPF